MMTKRESAPETVSGSIWRFDYKIVIFLKWMDAQMIYFCIYERVWDIIVHIFVRASIKVMESRNRFLVLMQNSIVLDSVFPYFVRVSIEGGVCEKYKISEQC